MKRVSSQTFQSGKHTYSVDAMISHIKTHKFLVTQKKIKRYSWVLTNNCWGSFYSPMDVLFNPMCYPEDIERIWKAKLKYPIIVTKNNVIVDGIHRYVKALLLGKKRIKTIYFNEKTMKKFKIK